MQPQHYRIQHNIALAGFAIVRLESTTKTTTTTTCNYNLTKYGHRIARARCVHEREAQKTASVTSANGARYFPGFAGIVLRSNREHFTGKTWNDVIKTNMFSVGRKTETERESSERPLSMMSWCFGMSLTHPQHPWRWNRFFRGLKLFVFFVGFGVCGDAVVGCFAV